MQTATVAQNVFYGKLCQYVCDATCQYAVSPQSVFPEQFLDQTSMFATANNTKLLLSIQQILQNNKNHLSKHIVRCNQLDLGTTLNGYKNHVAIYKYKMTIFTGKI
eukprot:TRINITY_DN73817_c0_g1_i1.p5 TRINITY_DN73817_c0_g1~~TRINITY_DN73817_c0_g1_i1.p5  ORF type:complete len:106 (-),score=1.84 TRINITY_DN73817_c0_g1_i1:312-629(-)